MFDSWGRDHGHTQRLGGVAHSIVLVVAHCKVAYAVAYSTAPSSSTTRTPEPSAPEASVRNTALPGPVRQISVVSVSPGNTGEVNRAAIEVTSAATPLPSSATNALPATP